MNLFDEKYALNYDKVHKFSYPNIFTVRTYIQEFFTNFRIK